MKYNDNGTVKNIVVKSGDTLPIGTIVEYDGTTIPDGYEEFETEDYGSLGNVIVDDIICKNIYDSYSYPLIINKAINGNDGTIYSSSVNWYTTEQYIPVNKYAGKNIISSSNSTTICFYDSSKTFISSIQKQGVIPANAYYMRFDTHKDYVNELYIELGKELTGYVPHKKFSNKQIYSTSEQVIGTWLGKPLYRKVVNFGTLPNNTYKNVLHNIDNLDIIHDYYAVAKNSSTKTQFKIPFSTITSASANISMSINASAITIETGSDRSGFDTCYCTLEYTKTTD